MSEEGSIHEQVMEFPTLHSDEKMTAPIYFYSVAYFLANGTNPRGPH